MAFPIPDLPTAITRSHMNQLNQAALRIIPDLRSAHRTWMERLFLRRLTSSQFVVLSAIVSRTFGWKKVIEVIPLTLFTDGMQDGDEGALLKLDAAGLPWFAGTGLDRSTVRKALGDLLRQGLISRFALHSAGRDVFAYMPVSLRTLQYAMMSELTFRPENVPLPFHPISAVQSELERHFALQFGGD